MNYFEFYNIPVSFFPDLALIKQAYFKKSKEFHPDFFTNTSEEEQSQALEQSSYNNIAYKTLSDKEKRFAYILQLENQIVEGEKEVLPQEFLFEMMEINEELEQLLLNHDNSKLDQFRTKLDKLDKELQSTVQDFLDNYPAVSSSELITIRDYFFKNKYLDRIRQQLKIPDNKGYL